MKDSPLRPAQPRDPPQLHGLNNALDTILVVFVCLVVAVALGVVIAALLRHRKFAWTWGLLGVPVAVLVILAVFKGVLPGKVAPAAIAASLGGLAGVFGWGLYRRVEDYRAGGDRETSATEVRGLLDGVRRRLAERRDHVGPTLSEGLPVGRNQRGELALVRRGSAESGSHVLIPGATGAGKSTSLAALLVEYVVRSGFGAVVLEAKIDSSLYDAAVKAAQARNAPFHFVSPSGPGVYDPLAHGSIDERSERLVAVENWGSADADFYRQAASPFLRLVMRALHRAAQRITLATVAYYCDPDELENLIMHGADPQLVEEALSTISALRSDERRAIAGLRARLRNLASSEFARDWLDPVRPNAARFDLREAIRRREVVYFRFDTDRTGKVGSAIAQMVLLDLGATASTLMGGGVGTFVAVDEFGALQAPALDRLYARGRAAGFSVAVGTQTLADLRAAGVAVRERIGATVESIVCHRIGEQADAEWVAELIGAVPTWQSTVRTDRLGIPVDEGTRTRGYRFEVNPSQLQRLGAGEAYVARLDAATSRRGSRVSVVPAWERLRQLSAAA